MKRDDFFEARIAGASCYFTATALRASATSLDRSAKWGQILLSTLRTDDGLGSVLINDNTVDD
jgi:hypothetical protein